LDRVKMLLNKHESIKQLFTNQWAFLRVIDPKSQTVFRLSSDHSWEKVDMISET